MTNRRTYSIYRLSVELNMSRDKIRRALNKRRVDPAETTPQGPRYLLEDVLAALEVPATHWDDAVRDGVCDFARFALGHSDNPIPEALELRALREHVASCWHELLWTEALDGYFESIDWTKLTDADLVKAIDTMIESRLYSSARDLGLAAEGVGQR